MVTLKYIFKAGYSSIAAVSYSYISATLFGMITTLILTSAPEIKQDMCKDIPGSVF